MRANFLTWPSAHLVLSITSGCRDAGAPVHHLLLGTRAGRLLVRLQYLRRSEADSFLDPHLSRQRCRQHPDLGYPRGLLDRKSTRLNSSHVAISYAVFCLKKKKIPDVTCSLARQMRRTY